MMKKELVLALEQHQQYIHQHKSESCDFVSTLSDEASALVCVACVGMWVCAWVDGWVGVGGCVAGGGGGRFRDRFFWRKPSLEASLGFRGLALKWVCFYHWCVTVVLLIALASLSVSLSVFMSHWLSVTRSFSVSLSFPLSLSPCLPA